MTIAGRKSYTEELQLVSATGTTQLRIRFYVVAGDTRVMISALAADPAGSGDLDSLTRVVEGLQ